MLKILTPTCKSLTMQFTGADLKAWYAEHGDGYVYICHVLGRVLETSFRPTARNGMIESSEVINALKVAVPNRFLKKTCGMSSVITNHMLNKYISRAEVGSKTRRNLLKHVPDDFVFTIPVHF